MKRQDYKALRQWARSHENRHSRHFDEPVIEKLNTLTFHTDIYKNSKIWNRLFDQITNRDFDLYANRDMYSTKEFLRILYQKKNL